MDRAVDSPPTAGVKFTRERVLWVKAWTPTLYSFALTLPSGYRFIPGQFARLGGMGDDGELLWRSYSIVSAPADDRLEFFSSVVPGGSFTHRLPQLRPGDEVLADRGAYGLLTTQRFAPGRDLWMLASGTGLGPYVSILRDGGVWREFTNVVVVHSVRLGAELAYRDDIAGAAPGEAARLRYLPVVTREPWPGALRERIPRLIDDGRLEAAAGLGLDLEHSRLMICGNPAMSDELRAQLTGRGFRLSRRAEPGHLAFENYW